MQSKEKIAELIESVKELTAQEREQFTSELILMMVNQSGNDTAQEVKSSNDKKMSLPEADSKELALLLKRLYYQYDEYIQRII